MPTLVTIGNVTINMDNVSSVEYLKHLGVVRIHFNFLTTEETPKGKIVNLPYNIRLDGDEAERFMNWLHLHSPYNYAA